MWTVLFTEIVSLKVPVLFNRLILAMVKITRYRKEKSKKCLLGVRIKSIRLFHVVIFYSSNTLFILLTLPLFKMRGSLL